MTSIAALTDQERDSLAARAQDVCVVYPDHQLPDGCDPTTGRVGVGPAGVDLALYVERGIDYTGDDPQVIAWIESGVKYFASTSELIDWIGQVAAPGPRNPAPTDPAAQRPPTPLPANVTELSDVRAIDDEQHIPSRDEIAARMELGVVGQDVAVATLAGGAARHLAKAFPRKPYSALLIGPTGVGKTQAAQCLADALTALSAQGWSVIQLDMGEYSERIAVSRISGASPGYIGYRDGSDLASALAENPRSVVVFDEIEKAHPAVWMSLLGLLDSGRVGGSNAERAILLFTSNLAASELGDVVDDVAARSHLRRHGIPSELVGRFGDVIVFQDLEVEAMAAIAAISVATIAADYGVSVAHIAPDYLTDLLRRVGDDKTGVRGIEYLVDADLGEVFADTGRGVAQIAFDTEPLVIRLEEPGTELRDELAS